MNDEHGEYDAADHGTPVWTYSDDEDLTDLAEAGANPHGWNDGLLLEVVLGRSDHEANDPYPDTQGGGQAATSREDVERLQGARSGSWTSCRRAIEAATGLAAWDLVEAAALRALEVAHDGNYRSERSLAEAARHVLVAKCANATLDSLAVSARGRPGSAAILAGPCAARRPHGPAELCRREDQQRGRDAPPPGQHRRRKSPVPTRLPAAPLRRHQRWQRKPPGAPSPSTR